MFKVRIKLTTWYIETHNEETEELIPVVFESLEDACHYLGEHYNQIIDDYPVTKIEICYE